MVYKIYSLPFSIFNYKNLLVPLQSEAEGRGKGATDKWHKQKLQTN